MKEIQNDWPAGLKKTKPRQLVLSVLENAKQPLSAMDICSEVEKGGNTIWLSTVYRILELLVKNEVVLKLAVMNSEMAVYEVNRFEHKHYAVCLGCHKIVSMENCPMEKFMPRLEEKDFHVTGHNLEVYGYCKSCARK